jgi:soluble lytic murein transglycosylase-like protein
MAAPGVRAALTGGGGGADERATVHARELPMRRALLLALLIGLTACTQAGPPPAPDVSRAALYPGETPEIRGLIEAAAARHGVPEALVQRVVIRESRHDPGARNGPYMGLMQIHPSTARGMGFRGSAEELLDPGVNLEYAVRYLRGAWLVADGDQEEAVGWYARGYYYEAKRRGMLEATGLR